MSFNTSLLRSVRENKELTKPESVKGSNKNKNPIGSVATLMFTFLYLNLKLTYSLRSN